MFRLGVVGSVVSVAGFIGYLCIGSVLHVSGIYTPPFALLSFSDPVFMILGFLTGGLICLVSGSLTVLTHFASLKGANTEYVLLMGPIAFGFGAATVRVTVGPILTWLAGLGAV